MTSRRTFIKQAGGVFSTAAIAPIMTTTSLEALEQKLAELGNPDPKSLASDDDFWKWVRMNYIIGKNVINFNNGGVSPHPKTVQESVMNLTALSNEAPSYYMWRVLEKDRNKIREKLAQIAGVDAEEIAINRNTTEGLGNVIFGLDLKKGDEVVHSNFIYPNMVQAWTQREMREGIVRKIAQLDLPSTDTKALVKAYTDQFTKKTKVVHIEHLINWTGQVMPVAEIAREARKIGAKVVVDGAHSFAHLIFKIPDLECDYFATSLHKWLGAPFGTGMLWMRKELIAPHWALFPGPDPKSDDIRKFENQGTRDVPAEIGISAAIEFHEKIGAERKYERLYYLKQYWVERVKDLPGVKIYCPETRAFSGALTAFGIEGKTAHDIEKAMFDSAKIHTTTITLNGLEAVRITPNVYTSIEEMDLLVEEIKKLV